MRSLGPEDTMPCWYYDKKEIRSNTPSIRDGIDPEVEARYRKEGARFITDTGNKMGLRHYETLATGIVYFHRFYMHHSFRQFPRYVTACCCLFLAGKVEETPKKCKDIIKAARSLLNDHEFAQFGEDPKEEVMTLERILLQTMKFDLQVDHPYNHLLRYAKCLKGNQQSLQTLVQMAWTFVNDSLYTTLCLQWEPEIIAIALMYLATKLSKFEVSDWNGRLSKHQGWWDMFVEDISIELLEDVCHQVLDLYSSNNAAAVESPTPVTPPQLNPTAQNTQPPQNVPKKIIKTHPIETVPAKTPLLEAHKINSTIESFQQGHRIAGPTDPPVQVNVLHNNYKYTAPPRPAAMTENFVPNQYFPPPANAPYSAPPFNEIGRSGQPIIESSSYPPAHYEASASFPPGFINTTPPPRAPAILPFSASVPVHYIPEASAFPRPPPTHSTQFPNLIFPPGVYPPPGFTTSSALPRAHQGMGRGGVPRPLIRPNSHSNWGI